jgi:hypothetical protein
MLSNRAGPEACSLPDCSIEFPDWTACSKRWIVARARRIQLLSHAYGSFSTIFPCSRMSRYHLGELSYHISLTGLSLVDTPPEPGLVNCLCCLVVGAAFAEETVSLVGSCTRENPHSMLTFRDDFLRRAVQCFEGQWRGDEGRLPAGF